MTERACVRGCTIRGEHYAACDDYGRTDGDCAGCVHAVARDGVMICHRCYGRLRRRIETAPALVAHLRTLATNVGRAKRYDRERSTTPDRTVGPLDVDLLDATRDILLTIYAGDLPASATVAAARQQALGGTGYLLERFDELANDADSITEWWQIVMAVQIPTAPDFWTITRALSRWPIEDRRRWASKPCPDCDLLTVTVSPPYRAGAPTWYACRSCDWERSDHDDNGRHATIGPYDASRPLLYPEESA